MVESDGAFRLTFVEGRGLLSLGSREFHALGKVDRLELEIPNLRFPFDLSGGVARFKNQRLQLRELALSTVGRDVVSALSRYRLQDYGIFDPEVELDGQRLIFGCRVVLGEKEAAFSAHALVERMDRKAVRVHVHTLNTYGFLSVPAPLLLKALFVAIMEDVPDSNRDGTQVHMLPPLVTMPSLVDFRLEILDLVMLATLPMQGWRLPARKGAVLRLLGGAEGTGRLSMVFVQRECADDDVETAPPEAIELVQYREYAQRAGLAEQAIAGAELSTAVRLLREQKPVESHDKLATARLLSLLIASRESLAEAEGLARLAIETWPGFLPALLCEAVIHSEHGRFAAAAAGYEKVAGIHLENAEPLEASYALIAAAQQWAEAKEGKTALDCLLRAMEHRPRLRAASKARILRTAMDGDWRLVPSRFGEESTWDPPTDVDEVSQLLDLARLGDLSKDAKLIRQAAEALEALLLAEAWPDGKVTRAEAAYQLAHLRLAEGNPSEASRWFGGCIEGEAPGTLVDDAWRELAHLLEREGDTSGHAQALMGWAGDTRIDESNEARAVRLRQAAKLLAGLPGRGVDAMTLLENVLHVLLVDEESLALLDRISRSDPKAVHALLRGHLGEIRPEDAKPVLKILARLSQEDPEAREDTREMLRLLRELDPVDVDVAFGLGRLNWDLGDYVAAMELFTSLLATPGLSESQFAEIHLCLAEQAFAEGKSDEGRQHMDLALGVDAPVASIARVSELLHKNGEFERLVAFLERKGAELPTNMDRTPIATTLLGLAERSGDMVRAETLLHELLALQPDDLELLQKLGSVYRATNQVGNLLETMERRWAVLVAAKTGFDSTVDLVAEGMELVGLLLATLDGQARAEKVLERLLEREPACLPALEQLASLLEKRGEVEAADVYFLRRLAQMPGQAISSLLLLRASARMREEGGAKSAHSLLKSQPIDALDGEVLALRAKLAEEIGDSQDARETLFALYNQAVDDTRHALALRLRTQAFAPSMPHATARTLLEEILRNEPGDMEHAKALFDLLGNAPDLAARSRAWEDLLMRAPGLPDACRARARVAKAELAHQSGEETEALAALEDACRLDSSDEARVPQRVVKARVLLSRGEHAAALEALSDALAIAPRNAEALALQGDLFYRSQAWEKARKVYTLLAEVEGRTRAVPAELLAQRRAELAEMFGDHREAESAYREVAAQNPRHEGAREVLAGFALARGDYAEAAFYLREMVGLLPKDDIEKLTHARHRLGEVYLKLEDFASARQNLELALASEPERAQSLDLLVTTLQNLALFREAAAMCERLARSHTDLSKKAGALFRKGEILRTSLADMAGANDSYLRASDFDPTFGPTLGRLVFYYWAQGDLANLADVGADLVQATVPPREGQEDIGILVGLATLLQHGDEALARTAIELPSLGAPLSPTVAATRLAELIRRVSRGSLTALDSALRFLFSVMPIDFQSELRVAAQEGIVADPADAGLSMVLGRVLERLGQASLARAAYSLAHFVDPGIGSDSRLAQLGEESKPRDKALDVSVADHPLCQGALRRVLRQLAPALTIVQPALSPAVPSTPLTVENAALCGELRTRMNAPRLPIVAQGDGAEVTFAHSQPLCITIGRKAESLPAPELRFFVARVLEQARAGTLAVVRSSAFNLRGLLQAVSWVTRDTGGNSDDEVPEVAKAWIDRLEAPEIRSLLPVAESARQLHLDADEALANLPELDGYIRGCRFTADRVGLLASGRPIVALRALAGILKVDGNGTQADSTLARRQEQMRASPALRELVAFMLSNEYWELVEGA